MHIPSKQPAPSTAAAVATAASAEPSDFRLRSVFKCNNTFDAALFTDPEEIFLMKKNGDVVQYDPNTNTETVKILNPASTR